jgi:hypothetical protein
MATGRAAFEGASSTSLIVSILRDEPPPISSFQRIAPLALDSLVQACLAKDPDERMQTAHDIGLQLRWIRDGLARDTPVAARPLPRRRVAAIALSAAIVAGLAGGYVAAGMRRAPTSDVTFRQMTFRRGTLGNARFSPDGQTLVYSAGWDGGPPQIYSMRVDTAEPVALPVPAGAVLAISRRGELAMLNDIQGGAGTLARVPLGGGGVHAVLDHVITADWAPDGATFAVLREGGGQRSIEYPIGTTVYAGAAQLGAMSLSPDGKTIAVEENNGSGGGWIGIIEHGSVRRLSKEWAALCGCMRWSRSGTEIWFSASDVGQDFVLHAVTRDGRERLVASSMGSMGIHDVASDGRVLLDHTVLRAGIEGIVAGVRRDLSWLDFSRPAELSADGKTLLLTESGAGAGPRPVVFVRRTDGSPAVRLTDGSAMALSPDGQSVAVRQADGKAMTVMPVGPGRARTLNTGELTVRPFGGTWLPDGAALVLNAFQAGHPVRAWLQPIDGGTPRPITPEGVVPQAPIVVSADSRFVLANDRGAFANYPIAGGAPVPIPGLVKGDTPLRWTADGALWVGAGTIQQPQIVRVDVKTGARRLWRDVTFPDRSGLMPRWFRLLISADGQTYVYGYARSLSDLYIADHLQ